MDVYRLWRKLTSYINIMYTIIYNKVQNFYKTTSRWLLTICRLMNNKDMVTTYRNNKFHFVTDYGNKMEHLRTIMCDWNYLLNIKFGILKLKFLKFSQTRHSKYIISMTNMGFDIYSRYESIANSIFSSRQLGTILLVNSLP